MVWSRSDREAVKRSLLFQELHEELRNALSPEVLAAMRLMVVTEMIRNGVPSELAEKVVAKKKPMGIEFYMEEP